MLSTSAEAPLRNDEAYSEANSLSTCSAGFFGGQDISCPSESIYSQGRSVANL